MDDLELTRMPLPGRRVYERIADRLADDLRSSGAAEGDRLPAERALAERYAVSRETLRAALAELAERGVVSPAASRGWFVTSDQRPGAGGGGDGVQGFADLAAAQGLTPSARLLERDIRAATLQEAERLKVAPGTTLFTMTRLRFLDGNAVVLEHNRLPLALCPALADADFGTASLFATLRAADPPQVPSVADYEVEARHPTPEERAFLQITDATPVLTADQLAYTREGRPLEYTVAVYRADRYRFRGSIAH